MRLSFRVRPYQLSDYRRDATKVILERLEWLRTDPARVLRHPLDIPLGQKVPPEDPWYAAKWSALARKRKAGLLLLWLHYVNEKHQLDMTVVLAQRLLESWVGCSISNKTLIAAFGQKGRDAGSKSTSWPEKDNLKEMYRDKVKLCLKKDREKQQLIKETLWEELNVPRNKK